MSAVTEHVALRLQGRSPRFMTAKGLFQLWQWMRRIDAGEYAVVRQARDLC